ncbi:MAG TPA: hypothetical protein VE422_44675 [Terriglobia bacterium]|nr:hypothetical protein [Terriglobia bacterium]
MLSHIEVEDASTIVSQHDKDIQYAQANRRHQPMTKGNVFQSDLLVTTQYENEESNRQQSDFNMRQ